MRKLILSLILLFPVVILQAHGASEDYLRSIGKIYSVVAGVVIIFMGIVIYLVRLDKKISRIEKEINYGKEAS